MEGTQNSTANAVSGYGYDEEDSRGYGTWTLGLTDLAAADHIGKAIGRVYAAAERTYAGYGRDELDERGTDAGHREAEARRGIGWTAPIEPGDGSI